MDMRELMRDWGAWIAAVVALIVLIALLVFVYKSREEPEPIEVPVTEPQVDNELPPSDEPKHPLPEPAVQAAPEAEPAPPLPPLEESDESIASALADLVGADAVRRHIVEDKIIPNLVVTIDNLPRDVVALRLRAVEPLPGRFSPSVQEGEFEPGEEEYELREEDFERYEPLVELVEAIDTDELVEVYQRHYPLFETAYEDLGYPSDYFNDRLVEVIDHLLATPEVEPPIELTRPHVLYEYADPALERRSAGQKALIRIGPDNAAIVKDKLRAIRDRITQTTSPDAAELETGHP
ncbi:hypothetical protein BH24PSE2_BH24PSE2_20200 [soil metagenome]